jgi:hypothetical protein
MQPVPGPEFWAHLTLAGGHAIEQWVQEGNEPGDRPEVAVMLDVDAETTHRTERAGGAGLPTLPTGDVFDGPVIHSFDA